MPLSFAEPTITARPGADRATVAAEAKEAVLSACARAERGRLTQTMPSKGGGFGTATLNYLAGPAMADEWAALKAEESRLIERLQKVIADRARLELHMALAGVTTARNMETTEPASGAEGRGEG